MTDYHFGVRDKQKLAIIRGGRAVGGVRQLYRLSVFEVAMSDLNQEAREDSFADACAAVAILTIVVGTVVYWLHGMPGY